MKQRSRKGPQSALILNAYSSGNLGDGMLVEEAVRLIREALGQDVRMTLVARDATSFSYFPGLVLPSAPDPRMIVKIHYLVRALRDADLIVGVGGGYARGDSLSGLTKYVVVHLTQSIAALTTGRRVVYLPQSVGPFPRIIWPVIRAVYRHMDWVGVRDERSRRDLGLPVSRRLPDCALLGMGDRVPAMESEVTDRWVLSTRKVGDEASRRLGLLAARMRPFDGYVQSSVLGNDDQGVMRSLKPERILSRASLLSSPRPMVVVAVRLHAALMAIRAGHFVIHLAYERKGFGAFEDLGLSMYCHNVNSFDVENVVAQATRLFHDSETRSAYRSAVLDSLGRFEDANSVVVAALRGAVARGV